MLFSIVISSCQNNTKPLHDFEVVTSPNISPSSTSELIVVEDGDSTRFVNASLNNLNSDAVFHAPPYDVSSEEKNVFAIKDNLLYHFIIIIDRDGARTTLHKTYERDFTASLVENNRTPHPFSIQDLTYNHSSKIINFTPFVYQTYPIQIKPN